MADLTELRAAAIVYHDADGQTTYRLVGGRMEWGTNGRAWARYGAGFVEPTPARVRLWVQMYRDAGLWV